ncbi:MAG: substrate-binding domain-containing protein [Chlorobiales bacterium]|nr:substrate-binding domain-containing protein [Chlorobiales bacterium]
MFGWKGFVIVLFVLLCIAVIVVVWITDNKVDKTAIVETAKSGILKVGVEPSLAGAVKDIVPVFSHYYPDASVELDSGLFEDLFNGFLRKNIDAMFWSGMPEGYEVSLLERKKMNYRLEPVARNAIVCIVNANNQVPFLTVEELAKIYTARKNRWDEEREIRAYLNNKDLRLQRQFLAIAAPAESHLTAWYAESDKELVKLVAKEPGAVGIMPFSRVTAMMNTGRMSSSFRIVPLCNKRGETPVMPTQYTVYRGEYPLDYIVYYMYRKEKALATGFGAWLAKEGQKSFVRSSLAPYKQPVRVIKLQ